ncbi:hypothetical protein GIB67_019346 [Kingdonia uniflora]|uniref:Uncharacterized protein n=1 Tax=Kingdonia uniflora TaxID=39325 RepID=A0A7J7M1S7_9MAGN|nr:hypothetical protein GIB67_019346 [Kingdonia uniflora]
MVSLQENVISDQRALETSSNKRKWFQSDVKEENFESKSAKNQGTRSLFDMEFYPGKRIPLDLKQHLNIDIQSGQQVHFNNIKAEKKTCYDQKKNSEAKPSIQPISLDLELHLSHDSPTAKAKLEPNILLPLFNKSDDRQTSPLMRCTSWLTFEEDHKEMIAAVCKKCHLLVMLCKSSPACPNCKFMHPLEQSPVNLVRPKYNFLSCKD